MNDILPCSDRCLEMTSIDEGACSVRCHETMTTEGACFIHICMNDILPYSDSCHEMMTIDEGAFSVRCHETMTTDGTCFIHE